MQDNFTNNIMETLIRYMDGELSASENEKTEKLLQNDAALRERYQHFLSAKKAIRSQGLKHRVQAIHQEYMQGLDVEKTHSAKAIRPSSFFKTFMSVAAVLILIVAGYGVFQYANTTNQSVYQDAFISYHLTINRGNEKTGNIDELYNAGNYTGVIKAFNEIQQKNQKDYFIAAQSYLQLNNLKAAIDAFHQVETINDESNEKYFVQETDYYLMLAYIKAENINLAEKQLDKITSNKQHLFYNKAKNISRIKLTMLKWKEK